MTLYADKYILINMVCDWLALWSSAKILSVKIKQVRLAAGALFMSFYALWKLLWGIPACIAVILNFACLVAGCLIAYKFSGILQLLKRMAVFFINCIMIGGIAGWIFEFSGSKIVFILFLTPVIYFCWLVITNFYLHRLKLRKVSVYIDGCRMDGFIDSGNMLTDPESGLPVIIVNRQQLNHITKELSIIKMQTAAGEGYLPVYRPDVVKIGKTEVVAMVAVDQNNSLKEKCIVPLSLV